MLGETNAIATIAVKDLEAAKKFYTETLGLSLREGGEEGALEFKTGNTTLFVYESQFAGTNKATVATWVLGEKLEKVVGTLKERGVRFEHYDEMPEVRREGDIHLAGKLKVAWFKDPEGNIHSLLNG